MGQIKLTATFSGGVGDLVIIDHDSNNSLHFDQNTNAPQFMSLSFGTHILAVRGAAPSGTGGNIALSITGDIPAEIDLNFPGGSIPPHSIIVYITT